MYIVCADTETIHPVPVIIMINTVCAGLMMFTQGQYIKYLSYCDQYCHTVCAGLMMLTQRQYNQNLSYHDVYCLCTFDDVCTETIGLLPVLP